MTATDASGNTATDVATIEVVDSVPPQIVNTIFKPASRGVMNGLGDVSFNCRRGNIAACGKRAAAQRRAGVATVQHATGAAMDAYLSVALNLNSSDDHPCHDDFAKVRKSVLKGVSLAVIRNRLVKLGAPKARRDQAVTFAGTFIKGGGSCSLRQWTVTDPALNVDVGVEVVCAKA